MQQFTQEFQKLGADLQSGNLAAAQADFATLQQIQAASSTSSPQSNSPIAQLFNQLSQDLKSGIFQQRNRITPPFSRIFKIKLRMCIIITIMITERAVEARLRNCSRS